MTPPRSPGFAADTAERCIASHTIGGGSAADILDHPTPPTLEPETVELPAGGMVDLSPQPAPPILPATAIVDPAGGLGEPPATPTKRKRRVFTASQFLSTRPPRNCSEALVGAAAGGRGLCTIDDLLPHFDAEAWDDLRLNARLVDEAQKMRVRVGNQLNKRGGFNSRDAILAAEKEIEAAVTKTLAIHWDAAVGPYTKAFIDQTHGVGEFSAARLLGETGHPVIAQPKHWVDTPKGPHKRELVADPPFIRSPRQWRQYCGLGDPTRRYREGMTQEEAMACGNNHVRVLAWRIAHFGFMKSEFIYHPVYEASRRRTEAAHPEWNDGHHFNAAKRAVAVQFIDDLYNLAWMDLDAARGLA